LARPPDGNGRRDDAPEAAGESHAAAEAAFEFLPKPFDPSRFLRVVRRVLDGR